MSVYGYCQVSFTLSLFWVCKIHKILLEPKNILLVCPLRLLKYLLLILMMWHKFWSARNSTTECGHSTTTYMIFKSIATNVLFAVPIRTCIQFLNCVVFKIGIQSPCLITILFGLKVVKYISDLKIAQWCSLFLNPELGIFFL